MKLKIRVTTPIVDMIVDRTGFRCKRCGSPDVRPAKTGGLADSLAAAIHRHPLRCRSCRARFYVRTKFMQLLNP